MAPVEAIISIMATEDNGDLTSNALPDNPPPNNPELRDGLLATVQVLGAVIQGTAPSSILLEQLKAATASTEQNDQAPAPEVSVPPSDAVTAENADVCGRSTAAVQPTADATAASATSPVDETNTDDSADGDAPDDDDGGGTGVSVGEVAAKATTKKTTTTGKQQRGKAVPKGKRSRTAAGAGQPTGTAGVATVPFAVNEADSDDDDDDDAEAGGDDGSLGTTTCAGATKAEAKKSTPVGRAVSGKGVGKGKAEKKGASSVQDGSIMNMYGPVSDESDGTVMKVTILSRNHRTGTEVVAGQLRVFTGEEGMSAQALLETLCLTTAHVCTVDGTVVPLQHQIRAGSSVAVRPGPGHRDLMGPTAHEDSMAAEIVHVRTALAELRGDAMSGRLAKEVRTAVQSDTAQTVEKVWKRLEARIEQQGQMVERLGAQTANCSAMLHSVMGLLQGRPGPTSILKHHGRASGTAPLSDQDASSASSSMSNGGDTTIQRSVGVKAGRAAMTRSAPVGQPKQRGAGGRGGRGRGARGGQRSEMVMQAEEKNDEAAEDEAGVTQASGAAEQRTSTQEGTMTSTEVSSPTKVVVETPTQGSAPSTVATDTATLAALLQHLTASAARNHPPPQGQMYSVPLTSPPVYSHLYGLPPHLLPSQLPQYAPMSQQQGNYQPLQVQSMLPQNFQQTQNPGAPQQQQKQ